MLCMVHTGGSEPDAKDDLHQHEDAIDRYEGGQKGRIWLLEQHPHDAIKLTKFHSRCR